MDQQAAIRFAAASRPFHGEALSGDAWQVDWHDTICRLAVIDGLGHGPEAAAAADAATKVLGADPELTPVAAIQECHLALHATRGAAMWVGALDTATAHLTWAGVGNVDARLWQAGHQLRLVGQRGIVGAVLPTLRAFEQALEVGWLLVVHTDGIRDRFDLEDMPATVRGGDPQSLVDGLIADWGRVTDDALVVAVRPA